jgi:mannosyl-oligosaccharide alpha-1,3-glucosidase
VTVKHENFKTCDQAGFCKRNRALADAATPSTSPYKLDASTIKFGDGTLTGTILKTINPAGETVRLPLKLTFLESGTARLTIDEEKRQKGEIELRHDSKANKKRSNEVEKWTIVGGLTVSEGAAIKSDSPKGVTKVAYGPAGQFEAVITHAPFGVEFKRDGVTHMKLNDRGFLNLEHWRPKVDKPAAEAAEAAEGEQAPLDVDQGEDESTWWDETFGGNVDTKPKGPESVGLDISFEGYNYVYGIPEHASSLSLKETRYGSIQFLRMCSS